MLLCVFLSLLLVYSLKSGDVCVEYLLEDLPTYATPGLQASPSLLVVDRHANPNASMLSLLLSVLWYSQLLDSPADSAAYNICIYIYILGRPVAS